MSRYAEFVSSPLMALSFVVLLAGTVSAQSVEAGIDFFEKSIRPVLVQHCYECHSAAAAEKGKLQAGLLLDSKQGVLAGGESGPAIVVGDPDQSLLIGALKYESYEMPPKGRLAREGDRRLREVGKDGRA